MHRRDRVLAALNFKEPDRVPLDLGGAFSCGISVIAYEKYVKYLGLEIESIEVGNTIGQLARVDEKLLEYLDVDVRSVGVNDPANWQLKIEEDEDYKFFVDEWGRKYKMPKINGHYYDIAEFPLEKIDAVSYKWPDPTDPARFDGLAEQAQNQLQMSGAAIVASKSLANGFLQMGSQLHGFSKWLLMLAEEPDKVEYFLDKLLDFKLKYWESYLNAAGEKLDVVCEADDLGMQNSTWISKGMYHKYIYPRQKKLFDFIKNKADVKILLHSCGSCYDFIPDLIDAGVDILNPVQVSAKNMDTKRLKKEFGSDLVFWGGGVDTQKILPLGSPKDVEEEVKRRIDDLAPGGGFIFSTVHNIQSDVPPENLAAMYETFHRYSKY